MPRSVYTFPPAVESCVGTLLEGVSAVALARAVAVLSAFFTSHRAARPKDYLATAENRSAYLAYFLPANYSKLQAVFDEMKPLLVDQLLAPSRRGLGDRGAFRVLDLGAGPGTMTLAALEYLSGVSPQAEVQFCAVDSSREMLKTCETLFHCVRGRLGIEERRARLRTRVATLQEFLYRPPPGPELSGPFDIIVLANVWNELVEAGPMALPTQSALIEGLLARLEDHGALILIEPALRETSRTLHLLHNAVLERIPAANVFAPCVHQWACPCVTSGNKKDWCHTEFEWRPTNQMTQIDQRIGNRKDALKFSYLVLRKDGKNVLDLKRLSGTPAEESACWRVVSELIVEKGKQRAFLCGEAGRVQFTRLDRHESPPNQAFGDLIRGDLVKITGAKPHGEEGRIAEATEVERV